MNNQIGPRSCILSDVTVRLGHYPVHIVVKRATWESAADACPIYLAMGKDDKAWALTGRDAIRSLIRALEAAVDLARDPVDEDDIIDTTRRCLHEIVSYRPAGADWPGGAESAAQHLENLALTALTGMFGEEEIAELDRQKASQTRPDGHGEVSKAAKPLQTTEPDPSSNTPSEGER